MGLFDLLLMWVGGFLIGSSFRGWIEKKAKEEAEGNKPPSGSTPA
jgi:hypothetical protein